MQAADIKPGKTYAIMHGDKPVRFHVDRIDTTKHRTHVKTTYSSQAYGHVSANDWEGELPANLDEREEILGRWVPVDQILGDYTEYVELEAKAQAEIKASKEAKALAVKKADQLVELFYLLTNTARPNAEEERRKPHNEQVRNFEDPYGYGSVQIDSKGVAALLPVLQEMTGKPDPVDP